MYCVKLRNVVKHLSDMEQPEKKGQNPKHRRSLELNKRRDGRRTTSHWLSFL